MRASSLHMFFLDLTRNRLSKVLAERISKRVIKTLISYQQSQIFARITGKSTIKSALTARFRVKYRIPAAFRTNVHQYQHGRRSCRTAWNTCMGEWSWLPGVWERCNARTSHNTCYTNIWHQKEDWDFRRHNPTPNRADSIIQLSGCQYEYW